MWAWFSIVGGTPVSDPMDPVVALVRDGQVVCSGALLHPEWVLTAAHCLDAEPSAVWWGTDVRDGAPVLALDIDTAIPHPAHDGRTYDVALLRLAGASPGATAILADGPPEPGDGLVASGFGATADGAGDEGTKRTVDTDVIEVDATVVTTYRGGANVCSGDSGGPLARPGTGRMEIVAVAGFVDPTCLGGAGGGSLADGIVPFVREHVPEWTDPAPPVDTGSAAPDEEPRGGCRTAPIPGAASGWIALVALARGIRRPTRCDKPTASRVKPGVHPFAGSGTPVA